MPSIEVPGINSGHYVPKAENFYIPKEFNKQSTAKQSQEEEKSETENKDLKTEKELQQLINGLSASDISSINNLDLLSAFSSLNTESNIDLSSLNQLSQNDENKQLLQNILIELKTLKENQSSSLNQNESINQNETSENKNKAKILRFSVNGYDILKTCKKIYISKAEKNGTFLFTGDRKYYSDEKLRKETFYILFSPSKNSSSKEYLSVSTIVNQDYLNEYSFLYQLSQMNNLQARCTGNLVSLRNNDENWKLDLLIDLGDE